MDYEMCKREVELLICGPVDERGYKMVYRRVYEQTHPNGIKLCVVPHNVYVERLVDEYRYLMSSPAID